MDLDNLFYSSVVLCREKLAVESDFGSGEQLIIDCENNIAKQIQFLQNAVSNIERGDFEERLKAMSIAVMNADALLRKRIELKKK